MGAKQQASPLEAHAAATDAPWAKRSASSTWSGPFRPPPKPSALEMVDNIKASMAEHIQTNTWMSAPTKAEALKKLNALRVKIGYPDVWKDYRP